MKGAARRILGNLFKTFYNNELSCLHFRVVVVYDYVVMTSESTVTQCYCTGRLV